MKRSLALAWLIAVFAPPPAAAQQVRAPLGETASDYPFHFGPVGLAPTLVIDNLGIDTNALLTPDNPVQDFMFRTTPGVAYFLPMQRFRLYGTATVSFQYYQKTTEHRSVDTVNQAALSFAANRVVPTVYGSYGQQRTRPNAEIEAMVAHLDQAIGLAVDLRFSPRFSFHTDGDQTRFDFEEREFRGAELDQQLNRTTDTIRAGVHFALTPISTLGVTANYARDRFQHSDQRDAENLSVMLGIDTKPSALIAGSAAVGYRWFNALGDSVQDYRGVAADLGMSYTLLDRTRFGVTGHLGLEYSAELDSPYYVISGAGILITQMLGHGVDIQVGANGDKLSYRTFIDPQTAVASGRTDRVDAMSAGFGFKLGDNGRFGFEVSHVTRRSPVPNFVYEGYRAGVKITYGT